MITALYKFTYLLAYLLTYLPPCNAAIILAGRGWGQRCGGGVVVGVNVYPRPVQASLLGDR